MDNYVFFIGGTGARVLQSFLHLCASGAVITNERINIAMLDVDSTNYACVEARTLYDVYHENYQKLHDPQNGDAGDGTFPAFGTRLEMREGGAAVINPITDTKETLELAASGSKRALEWFYTAQERNQPLKHGFFAHPNVGCLFFDGARAALKPYTDSMASTLNDDRDVRVAIVGSVFGGTGAAGIPMILRMIRENCAQAVSAKSKLQRLHFAGVLVTPYFKFKAPVGNTGNLHIHHNLFFGNTRSALEYYGWNYQEAFERIYLAGQDTLQFVSLNGMYSDGGSTQRNKWHIVELIAAMGVRHFLLDTSPYHGAMDIYEMILRSDGEPNVPVFGWNTLEPALAGVGDMLRTQALMRSAIVPFIEKRLSGRWEWFKAFGMNAPDNQAELKVWMRYSLLFLYWIYNIQYQLNEPDGNAMERDHRISLVGRPIENVIRGDFDFGRNFGALIENRTNAVNVTYRYSDGRSILVNLGSIAHMDRGLYSSLGTRGLFTLLFKLASEKV